MAGPLYGPLGAYRPNSQQLCRSISAAFEVGRWAHNLPACGRESALRQLRPQAYGPPLGVGPPASRSEHVVSDVAIIGEEEDGCHEVDKVARLKPTSLLFNTRSTMLLECGLEGGIEKKKLALQSLESRGEKQIPE